MNIGLTASFDWIDPNNPFRDKCLISFFEVLQQISYELKIFAFDWWSVQTDGAAKIFEVSNKKILETNVYEKFDLIHVFKLGYSSVKNATLNNKWQEYNVVLNILEKSKALFINPIPTLRYGFNKKYLFDLVDKGLPIIPTKKISAELNYHQLINECDGFFDIVKPINGECGKLVRRIAEIDVLNVKDYFQNSNEILLQPYIAEIESGEISLLYIGKKFSHGVLKKPAVNDFRANGPHVGATIIDYFPSLMEIDLGYLVATAFSKELDVYRVDYVLTKNGPLIMEVEVIDPGYYRELDFFCAEKLCDLYLDKLYNR